MDVDTFPPRRRRGFTLVELLTTLVIAGVSLAVVAPAWNGLTSRSQITTSANGLLADLRFARSTAVTRNRRIGVCPSTDGQSCSGDPRGWQAGYLVFIDHDGNRSRQSGEPLLRARQAQVQGLKMHSTAGRPAISLRPDGAAWSTNTTFSICLGADQDAYRAVVIYGTGRARVDKRAPGNKKITCA